MEEDSALRVWQAQQPKRWECLQPEKKKKKGQNSEIA